MIARLLPLALAAALAACAGDGRPPEPSGPWRALNAGRWTPTPDDLRGPRAPLPASASPNALTGGRGA